MGETRPVCVIGGGPAGLAAAAELRRRGMHPVILERGGQVGTSWRAGYDRLHLHTVRGLSGLPGFPIPRAAGRWASRDAVIDYLERYRAAHDLEVRGGTEAERITAAEAADGAGTRWVIHTAAGERLPARSVVVATGHAHTPYVPDWPGREGFTGQLTHAREYRNAAPFAGLDVLVAGVGNSGSEIATDLAEGGARRVWIAVRRIGEVPLQDVGFVAAVRGGTVTPVAAVTGLDGDKVLLADGSAVAAQAVVAATGYRRGLEKLAWQLGVLDEAGLPRAHGGPPAAPGLFFIGYTVSLRGMLRDIAADARRVAPAVARDHQPG